jgi:hypothetical protein
MDLLNKINGIVKRNQWIRLAKPPVYVAEIASLNG